jgi:hypothetical protein
MNPCEVISDFLRKSQKFLTFHSDFFKKSEITSHICEADTKSQK